MPHKKSRSNRTKSQHDHAKMLAMIPETSEAEKSNHRDIELLKHNWSPQETKFGETFKGKNKIIIA